LGAGGAASLLPEAAYRFCRDDPGADVVLSGTGDEAHLRENVRSLDAPPLPKPRARD
jgi:aryl-alcohol dehydrogenase-like predicted oxidoreductase